MSWKLCAGFFFLHSFSNKTLIIFPKHFPDYCKWSTKLFPDLCKNPRHLWHITGPGCVIWPIFFFSNLGRNAENKRYFGVNDTHCDRAFRADECRGEDTDTKQTQLKPIRVKRNHADRTRTILIFASHFIWNIWHSRRRCCFRDLTAWWCYNIAAEMFWRFLDPPFLIPLINDSEST